jgi:hypothetical protein
MDQNSVSWNLLISWLRNTQALKRRVVLVSPATHAQQNA